MIHATYLSALLVGIGCMFLLDRRFRLAFFDDAKRAGITLATGILVFTVWDILGINLGIFLQGNSPYTIGIILAPQFPLEELFFLFFLCYFTLVAYRGVEKIWQRHI